MRFPFGSAKSKHLKLVGPLGKEHSVDARVEGGELRLCAAGGSQVLESLPLAGASWLPCALPGGRDHCLVVQLASGARPRELVLRAPTRERVLDLLAQLDAASQASAQRSLQDEIQAQLRQQAGEPLEPSDDDEEAAGSDGGWGSPSGPGVASSGSSDEEASLGSPQHAPAASSQPSPPPAGPEELAPAAAAAALSSPPAAQLPPVRLLSFSSKKEGRVASHVEQLERMVSQLSKEVVAAAASRAGTPKAKTAQKQLFADQLDSAPSSPIRIAAGAAAASPVAAPPAAEAQQQQQQQPPSPLAPAAASGRSLPSSPAAAAHSPNAAVPASPAQAAIACAIPGGSSSAYQVQRLLDENTALAGQVAELEAALGAVRAQLELAAAANVRLAREAACTVREQQVAAGAVAAGRGREQQLQASLDAAVSRCEEVGRELALLTGRLERRAAQCEELQRAAEELDREKMVLTVALTTAQLQLKDATPAGFAVQVAEARQQCEAAGAEAAAARERALTAEREAAGTLVRLAETQKREAEVAEQIQQAAALVEEARAAQQAALGKEARLVAEVEVLKAQLAGRAAEGDPLATLQHKAEALAQDKAALLSQVAELQRVGEELSRSCTQLEGSLQAALAQRDSLRTELASAQQAQREQQAQWGAERAGLEQKLAGAAQALCGSEGSMHSSRSAAQVLQAQLDAAKQELAEARQRAAAREQELQSELKLQGVKADAELRALKDRLDVALGQQSAAAAQQAQREAAAASVRLETEAAQTECRRLQEEIRRLRDDYAVANRGLQLDASSLKAENARLAQEAGVAQSAMAALRSTLEAAQREAQQAQAQLAATVSAQAGLAHERKELQARLDRAAVERDRAARERDALAIKYAALQQQYRLLDAVAQEELCMNSSMLRLSSGACKENGGGQRQYSPPLLFRTCE